jgi:hypothetical protein
MASTPPAGSPEDAKVLISENRERAASIRRLLRLP